VVIADEVQVGLGRVGSRWWAFEVDGAQPDIVTMGKPLGNGHPLGAVATTRTIADAFANGMEYFNTFGGNAVSAAVGLAVLDVIEDEGLRPRAVESGARFLTGLRDLATRHPVIGDVRGLGLFLGVVLVADRESRGPATELAAAVVEGAKSRGILLSTDGPYHDVLKIKPPLVIEPASIDRAIEVLDEVLSDLA
jgi:4-aminobutyrate aminotransferase-like enzyme